MFAASPRPATKYITTSKSGRRFFVSQHAIPDTLRLAAISKNPARRETCVATTNHNQGTHVPSLACDDRKIRNRKIRPNSWILIVLTQFILSNSFTADRIFSSIAHPDLLAANTHRRLSQGQFGPSIFRRTLVSLVFWAQVTYYYVNTTASLKCEFIW